ncbi:MAG TPA: hypothetical protein VJK72_04410 [Candidatus Nanoarchaeia archaeon]|nr:hypothetical protein [Candidatus Nanoarchaeia archaeon]
MQRYKKSVQSRGSLPGDLEFLVGIGPGRAGLGLKMGEGRDPLFFEKASTNVDYWPSGMQKLFKYMAKNNSVTAHRVMCRCFEETLRRTQKETMPKYHMLWQKMESYARRRRPMLPADLHDKVPDKTPHFGSDNDYDYMQICKNERWGVRVLMRDVRMMGHVIAFGQQCITDVLNKGAEKTPDVTQIQQFMYDAAGYVKELLSVYRSAHDGFVRVQKLLGYPTPREVKPFSFEGYNF